MTRRNLDGDAVPFTTTLCQTMAMQLFRLAYRGFLQDAANTPVMGVVEVPHYTEEQARRAAIARLGRQFRVRRLKSLERVGPPDLPDEAYDEAFWVRE